MNLSIGKDSKTPSGPPKSGRKNQNRIPPIQGLLIGHSSGSLTVTHLSQCHKYLVLIDDYNSLLGSGEDDIPVLGGSSEDDIPVMTRDDAFQLMKEKNRLNARSLNEKVLTPNLNSEKVRFAARFHNELGVSAWQILN